MSKRTLFTFGTSITILSETVSSTGYGILYQFALTASLVVMALKKIVLLYVLFPFVTPVTDSFGSAAKYCQISLSSPALSISSLKIASASLNVLSFSAVTSPKTLTPSPGSPTAYCF